MFKVWVKSLHCSPVSCLHWASHGPGADPEKWKERWLKWRAESVAQNFWLIKYSLEWLCVNPHALAAFSVLPPSWRALSEWLICISSYTLFTRMVCSSKSESAQMKNIMDTVHPRGVASHPIHPPWISPCGQQRLPHLQEHWWRGRRHQFEAN